MAHATRSHSSTLSDAEFEIRQKQLDEKERQIRDQAAAVRRKEEDLQKKISGSIDVNSLMQMLNQMHSELLQLKKLPEQVLHLEKSINEPPTNLPTLREKFSSTPVEISAPSPILKLKDVIANIPNYDGYKISIFQFSRACERARRLLPASQEPQLVQLIINKLEGDAYQLTEGNEYYSVDDLIDKLKTIFAPHKTVSQYRGELANIYKLPTESILKYVGRIKDLRTAIIDTYRRTRGGVDSQFIEEIDNEVLEAFINGLPSNIITRIEYRQIGNLDEAIEWAIKISRALEVEAARETRYAARSAPAKIFRADPHLYQPTTGTDNVPRQILTKSTDAVPRPFIKPLVPGQPGPNSPNCRYCKSPGHDISTCRKLAYKNQSGSGNADGRPVEQGASQETAAALARPTQQ